MFSNWLIRAKRWVQNPPSPQMVKFILIIVAICAAIALYEAFIGLPEWMEVNRVRRPRMF